MFSFRRYHLIRAFFSDLSITFRHHPSPYLGFASATRKNSSIFPPCQKTTFIYPSTTIGNRTRQTQLHSSSSSAPAPAQPDPTSGVGGASQVKASTCCPGDSPAWASRRSHGGAGPVGLGTMVFGTMVFGTHIFTSCEHVFSFSF